MFQSQTSRSFAIFCFILLGISSRLFPHLPNFTALNSIILLSASSLGSAPLSLFIIFAIMAITDLIFGCHASLPFVYLSFGLIACIGHWMDKNYSIKRSIVLLSASSLLFFIITNFSSWLSNPLYPKTLAGLQLCYLAALPFLANQILGDLTYGILLLGCLRTYLHRSKAYSYRFVET